MRIAHIDTGTDFRGGQELLLTLARGLRDRGHDQVIVCPLHSALEKRATVLGLKVLGVPGFKPSRARGYLVLRQRLKQDRFQIVHSHNAHAQTISAVASIGLNIRRVASRLVAFPPRHPAVHRLKYTWTCDRIIALSDPVRSTLLTAGVPDAMIEVIQPGIDPPELLPTPEERRKARQRWSLCDHHFAIGHVAAFTSEKGQASALEAAGILSRVMPDARLLLAGEGPLRASPEMAGLLKLAGGIARMPGFVEDLAEFHAALDLYIMPSRSEAWGLAALHAMSYGLPVVASNVGGLSGIVEDGKTGWLVPPGDAPALAQAIADAAADRERLAEFSRRARERSFLFSTAKTVERTEALYRQLLKADEK